MEEVPKIFQMMFGGIPIAGKFTFSKVPNKHKIVVRQLTQEEISKKKELEVRLELIKESEEKLRKERDMVETESDLLYQQVTFDYDSNEDYFISVEDGFLYKYEFKETIDETGNSGE
jgi:hypothetical protein